MHGTAACMLSFVMPRPGAEGTGIKTAVRVEAKSQTQRVDLIYNRSDTVREFD